MTVIEKLIKCIFDRLSAFTGKHRTLSMESSPVIKITDFFSEERRDARRIFHGRGQLFPGFEQLSIDWFNPIVLISLFDDSTQHDELLTAIEAADSHKQVKSVVVQRRYLNGSPAELVMGVELETIIVTEGPLRFEIHAGKQQNAGLFLDARLLRDWIQQNSADRKVLNLFAYTCSLSVAALAGGASQVTNVDMSKTSINWGLTNHMLNEQDARKVKSIPHNIFRSWGRIQQFGRYDLVIIDPPTRQRGSFDVEKNYGAVLKRLSKLCTPGADVIATLNSPFLETDYLTELFAKKVPTSEYLGKIEVAPEFEDKSPERALKICHFKMP